MTTLQKMIPDVDVLLALAPEELAPYVLQAARAQMQNGMVHPNNLVQVTVGFGMAAHTQSAYGGRATKVELAIAEAWNFLQVHGFVVPASGINGSNGFCVFSRRGQSIKTPQDFSSFQAAAAFPKGLLHPSIADKVWLDLARGELADAVFTAFRAVEEAVRSAAGYGASEYGVDMMRKAFDPKGGPVADMAQEKSEREALAHLFAGAIGSYKNPHSHRTVSITDPQEAQEMVMLASHLLRIVDVRGGARKEKS